MTLDDLLNSTCHLAQGTTLNDALDGLEVTRMETLAYPWLDRDSVEAVPTTGALPAAPLGTFCAAMAWTVRSYPRGR